MGGREGAGVGNIMEQLLDPSHGLRALVARPVSHVSYQHSQFHHGSPICLIKAIMSLFRMSGKIPKHISTRDLISRR